MVIELIPLFIGVFLVAVLYSSVGHAGASGYIAVMSLAGLAPESIRPMALALNVLVAGIATWQFVRAGHFRWPLFWPFALTAVPSAFIGGYFRLPDSLFQQLVGAVLIGAAIQLLWQVRATRHRRAIKPGLALLVGAGLGLLAGLTGTGGGIFLTPLLLVMAWSDSKEAAAVSAPFILLNSIAGLAGIHLGLWTLPAYMPGLMVTVVAGGAIGSHWGSYRLGHTGIRRLLACVLMVAGLKFIWYS